MTDVQTERAPKRAKRDKVHRVADDVVTANSLATSVMQFALFGLLTAILALKRPYLTLDLWVQRSPHEIGLSPAMWAGDRLNVGLLCRGGFFPRFKHLHWWPPTLCQ